MVIETPITYNQIQLVAVIEAHSMEWYIQDGALFILIPWTRKTYNGFESGQEETEVTDMRQLREVLGY